MDVRAYLLLALLGAAAGAGAREIDLPVRFDDELIRRYLVAQAYTDGHGTARAWDDGSGCNSLVLSDPKVRAEDGLVRVRSAGRARLGTAVGDGCLTLLDWTGFVEILDAPVLSEQRGVVEFRVVDTMVYGQDGLEEGVTGTLWDAMKTHVHPRLERLKLDLNPALGEIEMLLPILLPRDQGPARAALESVALTAVEADGGRLTLHLQFDLPAELMAAPVTPAEQPPLTADELQRWSEASHVWDAFLTLVVKRAGAGASPVVRAELLEVLLDTRREIVDILASPPGGGADPLHVLFVRTWSRLAPVLRAEGSGLPADSALRWLSLVAAADALETIKKLAPDLGLTLSADALRRLARVAMPDLPADAFEYGEQVDPELRRSLGFGTPLSPPDLDTGSRLEFGGFFFDQSSPRR